LVDPYRIERTEKMVASSSPLQQQQQQQQQQWGTKNAGTQSMTSSMSTGVQMGIFIVLLGASAGLTLYTRKTKFYAPSDGSSETLSTVPHQVWTHDEGRMGES
jgi:hypothetical protein